MTQQDTAFAKAARHHRTHCDEVIVASCAQGGRLHPVSLSALHLLRRLISADGRGIPLKTLSQAEVRILRHEIEGILNLRLTRNERAVALANTVAICDQRTQTEAA